MFVHMDVKKPLIFIIYILYYVATCVLGNHDGKIFMSFLDLFTGMSQSKSKECHVGPDPDACARFNKNCVYLVN